MVLTIIWFAQGTESAIIHLVHGNVNTEGNSQERNPEVAPIRLGNHKHLVHRRAIVRVQ